MQNSSGHQSTTGRCVPDKAFVPVTDWVTGRPYYRLMNSRLISADKSSSWPDRSRHSVDKCHCCLPPAIPHATHSAPTSLPPHQYSHHHPAHWDYTLRRRRRVSSEAWRRNGALWLAGRAAKVRSWLVARRWSHGRVMNRVNVAQLMTTTFFVTFDIVRAVKTHLTSAIHAAVSSVSFNKKACAIISAKKQKWANWVQDAVAAKLQVSFDALFF